MRIPVLIILVGTAMLPTTKVWAQNEATLPALVEELRRLRTELGETRAELQRLRTEVDGLKGAGAVPATVEGAGLPAAVEMLQSQVAEQAQSKVQSESRLPVTFFGTIHSSLSINSGEANWLESPNIVGADRAESGSLAWTARQTRLGVRADGLTLGKWQGSATTVFDFFGGVPNFQTGQTMGLPRLVYAYARFDRGPQTIVVGQDAMILAPRNPSSIAAYAFPLLYRSGNLYLRLPQARVDARLSGRDGAELRASAGIVAPIAGDFTPGDYVFAPAAAAGERSGSPGVQARVNWQQNRGTRSLGLGLSGHFSRERQASDVNASWATALDFEFTAGRVGVTGEGFIGRNLDAFGGGLGQPVDATGGFLEARFRGGRRWDLAGGAGVDAADGAALSRNTSGYGSFNLHLSPEVTTSFEYRWLQTTADVQRRNHHFNWAMTYGF